jgi:predicted CXXCH cytochrome family protein
MTRSLKMLAAMATVLASGAGVASASGIAGSPHDFSTQSWSDSEICKPCHTPHNAVEANVSSRLWNHQLSTAAYTLHGGRATGTGTTLDATRQGGQTDMDMGSRLCLGCHDGTVALDSFGGKTGSQFIAGAFNLGTDLSNDHPVGLSVVYNENSGVTNGVGHYRYNPVASATAAGVRFVEIPGTAATTPYVDRSGATTSRGTIIVSCVSCHDVHNGEGFDDGLLRADNSASKLCLACHDK